MSKKNTDEKPMSKSKKALNIALIVFEIAIVIVAIAFSISILLSTGYESSSDFGESSIRLMPVLTDSMAGDKEDSFEAGDLIIVKSAEKVDLSSLKVGDIVTYLDYVGGDLQFVTHRIIDIEESEMSDGAVIRQYTTMGDAEDPETAITKKLYAGDIKGVYVGKLAGVGNAVFWLQDPTHFFLVIMLPLILLLLYNAYLVVRIIIEAKLKKQREQLIGATADGAAKPLDEEEIKRLAVEEYIKKKAVEDYIKEQELNAAKTGETPEAAAVTAPAASEAEKAETAEEKTEQVEKTSDNTEKETENAEKAADNVEKAAENVEQTSDNVEQTSENVEQTTDNVERTTENVERTTENVEQTTEKVEKAEKKPAAKPAAKKSAKTATGTGAKTAAKPAAKSTSGAAAAKKTAKTAKSEGGAAKKTAAKSAATKTAAAKTAKTAAKKTDKKS